MKRNIWDSFICAMAASMYFGAILPLQSYLSNAESFPFQLGSLLIDSAIIVLILTITLTVLSYCCSLKFGRIIHLALLVGIVLAMLESGPLAIGLPELNGEFEGYRSIVRTVVDASLLIAFFALPWLFYRRIVPFLSWIAVALMVYSVATVFDVKRPDQHDLDDSDSAMMMPMEDVVKSVEFSPVDNVIVLILDATSQFVVQDIMRDSQLASHYEGFVNYVNNVGMHWNTSVAIPGLMTGKYYENALELPRYGRSSYGSGSFSSEYIKADIPVYVNVGPGRMGCCNRPLVGEAESAQYGGLVLNRPMYGQFELSLAQLCAFRLLPYGLKEGFLQRFIRKHVATMDMHGRWRYESNLYPLFVGKGVAKKLSRTLHVHHTESGHPPIIYDEHGKSIVCANAGYDAYRGQCKNAFRCAAEMFDVWKTNGIYDASTIIMAADHSASSSFMTPGVKLNGADPHAFPFLMVKPRGDRAAYRESDIPTSHCRISEVLRRLASHPMERKEIESVLCQSNRLVRLAQGNSIVDWTIDSNRQVTKIIRQDKEPDIKGIKSVTCGKKYTFRIDSGAGGTYPDFVVQNGNRNVTTGLAVHRSPMKFRFRVEDPNRSYQIVLSMKARATHFPTNNLVVICGGTTNRLMACTRTFASLTTTFENVMPDADGIVECVFGCEDVGYANYVLCGMEIRVKDFAVKREPVNNKQCGILCLSFDDVRSIKSWVENIPTFAKYGARCTFFPDGKLDANKVEALRKLHDAGHEIGLHTVDHKRTAELIKEIGRQKYLSSQVDPQRNLLVSNRIPVRTFSYPYNHRNSSTDEFLLSSGFKRLRASVGDYSKMLKAGVRQSDMDGGFTNAQSFCDIKVVRAFPISTNMVEMLRILERAAERHEFVGMYSHAISSEHTNDVPRENLEAILKRAKELGLEFRTLAD